MRRTVVITGASGRLGHIMGRRFENHGDRVVRIDRTGTGGFAADLTDESAVFDVFEAVARSAKSIDAVVHTVGTWDQWPLLNTRLGDWERMMNINLTSAFLCVREAVRHMHACGGTIICIGARPGVQRASTMGGAYAASKAGLMRLVEAAAAEHPTVRSFAIAPSFILYGDEPEGTRGVSAAELADLAIELTSDGEAKSGTTLEAYGSLA